ncbi:hypothetical protein AALA17_06375 [Lactobacillaceae bacterium 24-114]
MSLMQDTAEINKTDRQVYLVSLLRKSPDLPMYFDQMIYDSSQAGQKFMKKLVAAFVRAGYREEKLSDDHYKLDNGLDKIDLRGKLEDVYQD